MEYPLGNCGRGLHGRVFLFVLVRRFQLLESRVKLAHRKARYESSYRSREQTLAGIGFWIDSHLRLPADNSAATLATSDKNTRFCDAITSRSPDLDSCRYTKLTLRRSN